MRRRSNSKSRSGTPTKRNSSPSTSHKKNSSPSPVKARSSARSKDTFSTPTKVSSKSLEKAATRAPVVEKDVPKYTWQQVAQHNVQSDMWVIINEKVYDITDWVDRHPGGIEMLRLVAGRDITVAFDNYHPFTKKHEAVLPKYYVGDLVEGSYEFPPYKKDTGMFMITVLNVNVCACVTSQPMFLIA